jgi:hypothetical protein
MDSIRDLSWMRQVALSTVERFEHRGFDIAIVSVPPTSAHHGDRFRYRLLAFDPSIGKPVLSVGLESDILGDFCLSVETAAAHEILSRCEVPMPFEDFRALALAAAGERLSSRLTDAENRV